MSGCKREAAAEIPKRQGTSTRSLASAYLALLGWAEGENTKTRRSRDCMERAEKEGLIR